MARDEAYYEAEKKIEEALKSGATRLDFHGMKLTELPESIWQLTQLTDLYLAENQLTALPESLGQLTQLQTLELSDNQLITLPDSLGRLMQLEILKLSHNQLSTLPKLLGQLPALHSLQLYNNNLGMLPEFIGHLSKLESLNIGKNSLTTLPGWFNQLENLQDLVLSDNKLDEFPKVLRSMPTITTLHMIGCECGSIPVWISEIKSLENFSFAGNNVLHLPPSVGGLVGLKRLWAGIGDFHNKLSDLPPSLAELEHLETLNLDGNPLNPELAEAYEQGIDGVKAYLRARAEGEDTLNEAKLILVGEGGVGKTSLLGALHGDDWVENRKTTYGMEVDVTSLILKDPVVNVEIAFNGWDFGGQDIYRHTHQLFFTAPAVYLAVWEPRRGPQQSRVSEWIKMIKHRAYDESRPDLRPRVLVVATHGGPKERLAHIDEQALRDEFGDLIAGFYHVDSRPDENGICYQLDQLKNAIAREAASIPSVGRSVPLTWKNVLAAVRKRSAREPYISYSQYESLCSRQGVSKNLAKLYAIILNELGYIIHYRNDEVLNDTVILKPDYLSKAVSFILEDRATKEAKGLVEHHRLSEIWNDPARPARERYPNKLHPIFLKLMERFDLSYQVNMPEVEAPPTSLMAQLVPSVRPDGLEKDWVLKTGDVERTQVCRIFDSQTGRTVEVEGLMYRLIVRLHRYSLGRKNYDLSRHWKTGLILDDGFNGRAFVEEIGGDVYVTVRAAYPERFLHQLCTEVQWLVQNFWKGLDAKLFVPCTSEKCKGLLEIDEMMDNKSNELDKIRCSVCRKFHEIDSLMATMQPKPVWDEAVAILRNEHRQILQAQDIGFDRLSTELRVLMSQSDEQYENLLTWLSDPAKDGPRLFSIEPVQLSRFDPANWTHETFRITLWCEHARVPLPALNGKDSKKGVYEINLTREWFQQAAPVLKLITTTASLILPVASAGLKMALDETIYKKLDFSKEVINASVSGFSKSMDVLTENDMSEEPRTNVSSLRELHAFLQKEDPTFGDLKRVQNKRQEFLWVHEKFASEY